MKRLAFLMLAVLALPASAKVKTETIGYKDGDAVLEGYLAYDDAAKGKRPGVLVVHEWWGMGPYAKRRAEMLAQLGYVAFAADMYGKGVYAKDHDEAGKLSGALKSDRTKLRQRALAGLAILKARPEADASKLAAIGYCFGGTTVLELARAGADLRGVASFHGSLDTPHPEETKAVKAKVLVLQGADDQWTRPGLAALEDELKKAGADYQINVYSGAVHSFTVKEAGDDPKTGMAYNAAADARSWQALKDFLKDIFE